MKSKSCLAVDFDDVLFPFSAKFIPYVNKHLGTTYSLDDIKTYTLEKAFNLPYPVVIDLISGFMNESYLNDLDPIEGSKEGLLALKDKYNLVIVTARIEEYKTHTEAWLGKYLPDIFSEVHYCSFYSPCGAGGERIKVTKLMKCNEIGAIGLIDDNAKNVANVISGGLRGILFGKYAWHNELPAGVNPIKLPSWSNVDSIF